MTEKRSSRAFVASLLVVAAAAVVAWLWTRERPASREAPEAASTNAADASPAAPRSARPRTPRSASERRAEISVVESGVAGAAPLADVVVTMHRRGAHESVRSTSDASGRATFLDLADGEWLAAASAPGHESATAPCAVADGLLAGPVELVLKKRGVLRGTVHDAAGSVAAKALVVLHVSNEESVRRMLDRTEMPGATRSATAETDDYGRYVLSDVAVEKGYVIVAKHPHLGVRTFDVPQLSPGEERTVDVALERVASVHGEIPAEILGDGRGVVDLMRRNGKGIDTMTRLKIDPEHREYLFQPVESGEKLMSFTVRNGTRFYAGFLDLTVAEGERVELGAWRPLDSMLKLRLTTSVEGLSARDANLMFDATEGEPRWYVNLMHVRVPIGVDFTLQGMRPGNLRLSAAVMSAAGDLPSSAEGCATDEFEFDGQFAQRELALVAPAGPGPKGVMRFRVAPPPGVKADDATLHWILWSGRNAIDTLPRNRKGLVAFNSGQRRAGRYRVEVFGEGFVASKEYDQGDGDAEMSIPASEWTRAQSLAGVVRSGGDPAPGARIAIAVKNETGEEVELAETHAAADGAFEFRSLPQTTELSLVASDGKRASRPSPISGFQSATGVVLELPK